MERTEWLDIRRRNAEAQDVRLETTDYDASWGEIEDLHRRFVDLFLSSLPPDARVLDAASGTGEYFGMVRLDLQDLNYRNEFDGVMCVDAMESLPPDDWLVAFDRSARRSTR